MTNLHNVSATKEVEVSAEDIRETDCDFAANVFRALSSGEKMEDVCYACLAKWSVHRGALPRE